MTKRTGFMVLVGILMLALSGCTLINLVGEEGGEEQPLEEGAVQPGQPTPTIELAPTLPPGTVEAGAMSPPTLTPGAEGEAAADGSAPTAMPAPTEIVPGGEGAAEGEEGDAPINPESVIPVGPGVSISPQLGEPGELVMVDGDGFEPFEEVFLYWTAQNGTIGDDDEPYFETQADENGSFSLGLLVLPADQWPNSPPREGDQLQLRAYTKKLGDFYYWADFMYVKRFDQNTSLVLTYTSDLYGYEVDTLNLWTWNDEEEENVRFASPSGVGKGFVRVVEGYNIATVIQAVMEVEAPGQTYSTEDKTLGAYQGTEVVAANGLTVWFIPSGNRVYAVSFTDDAGNFSLLMASSFRLK
jgi:hypothetical protein